MAINSPNVNVIYEKLKQRQQLAIAQSYATAWDTAYAPDPIEVEKRKQRGIAALAQKIDSLKTAEPVKLVGRIPDHCVALVGWRGWKISGEKLCALGMTGIWEPKKAGRAVCTASISSSRHTEPAPAKDCKCGYWSFRTLDLLKIALGSYAESVQVIGEVHLWGKVIECENGFRSEFAYPKELWLLEDNMESLSWRYGVPVRRLSQ